MVDISNIKNITVIGTGIMGRGIAQLFLMAGFEKVVINDIKLEVIEEATRIIEVNLKKSEEKDKLGEGITAEALMTRLIKEPDFIKAVTKADFIIEVVQEIMDLKQEVFKQLGQYTPEHAILASNTSAMSITKIAEPSGKPEQVIGMHFNLPPLYNRLIEVIKGEKTSDEAFERGIAVAQKIPSLGGKRFVARIEKECTGHIFNRINIATNLYFMWLIDHAFDKGISWQRLDVDAMSLIPVCPYLQWDYIGLDTTYNLLKYFEETVSPEFAPGKILTKFYKEGNFGRKTGKGLYDWTEDGKPIIGDNIKKADLLDLEIFFAIALNEGCRLLEMGIVSGYKTIDDIMFAGINMPGIFSAGKRNYDKWSKMLEELSEKSGIQYFKPCELMKTGGFIKMRK